MRPDREGRDSQPCFPGEIVTIHRTVRAALLTTAAVTLVAPETLDGQVRRRMARPATDAETLSGDPVAFLDAHVHLNDPGAWVALMDEAGIQRAVVLAGRDIDNPGLLAASRTWPGRLVPFVSISPEHREFRDHWRADDPTIVAIADSLLTAGGFYGIGEISAVHFPGAGFPEADFDPAGWIMRGLLAVAGKHGVPITVHVEVTRLPAFETVLAEFRETTVIWAHGGYVPLVLARRLLGAHPNLVFELSARTWARHPRSPDYTILRNGTEVWPEWLALIEEIPDRFVIGTDASLRSTASDQRKIAGVWNVLRQLDPRARDQVARTNMIRILKLEP